MYHFRMVRYLKIQGSKRVGWTIGIENTVAVIFGFPFTKSKSKYVSSVQVLEQYLVFGIGNL